ncbi:MAG: hypothetical protein ACE5F8_07010 [Woeseiaceae bacterium]
MVLTANYDARLTVAGAKFHVTSQAKVRNGRTFPIDFQDHRIDVTISTLGDGKYRAYVNVFERHDNDWRKVTRDELEFEAAFAAPIQFEWAEGELSMDVAIAVSISKT